MKRASFTRERHEPVRRDRSSRMTLGSGATSSGVRPARGALAVLSGTRWRSSRSRSARSALQDFYQGSTELWDFGHGRSRQSAPRRQYEASRAAPVSSRAGTGRRHGSSPGCSCTVRDGSAEVSLATDDDAARAAGGDGRVQCGAGYDAVGGAPGAALATVVPPSRASMVSGEAILAVPARSRRQLMPGSAAPATDLAATHAWSVAPATRRAHRQSPRRSRAVNQRDREDGFAAGSQRPTLARLPSPFWRRCSHGVDDLSALPASSPGLVLVLFFHAAGSTTWCRIPSSPDSGAFATRHPGHLPGRTIHFRKRRSTSLTRLARSSTLEMRDAIR